jgi:hypothetical protein
MTDSNVVWDIRGAAARSECLQRAMDHRMAALTETHSGTATIPESGKLIYLLNRAAEPSSGIPEDRFVDFATRAVALLGRLGAADQAHEDVIEAIDATISRIGQTETSVVPLLLAKATFLSYAGNESGQRLAALRDAERRAEDSDRLQVQYWLVWYWIDASRYGRAVRACTATMETLSSEDGWYAIFLAARGVAKYTTLNRPSDARSDLESAVQVLSALPLSETVARSLGEALHYLGRIALDSGDARPPSATARMTSLQAAR